ncbi:MAG: hypothetical protein HY289_04375 [Planctomycetes bacterium]|nr:hypothetical protein [Planctomycetota bacterium]
MPITLTCTCGRQQTIANTMAGRSFACAGCGKTMTVPAMGVLATPMPKPMVQPVALPSSARPGWLLLAAGVVLLLISGGGWLIWSMTRETPTEMPPIARTPDPQPELKRPIEPPSPPKKPVVEEKEWPPLRTPFPSNPYIELPKVIEPVKPKLPEVALIEPVKQEGELPNPFLLPPIKEPLPKVVEKKPNVMEPLKLVWRLKENDVFFQELMVAQQPNFKVAGIPFTSQLRYRIVSRFSVKKVNADGSLVVEQRIESAKLLAADDLTKAVATAAVAKMPGTTYKLELGPKMDVTKFEGVEDNPKIAAFQAAGGMGMQMISLLDRDGWKELAQATFFQMDQPLKVNERWSKPMKHNWGSLGSWSGQIHYLYLGKQANQHKVAYGLQLAYKAPGAGMVGLMKVDNANFQTQQAEGVILFDATRGRVVGAEERFRVRGVVNATLVGQQVLIEIEENQHFLIRIHEKLVP